MTPCSVLFIPAYEFDDGAVSDKRIICLNGGTTGTHITVTVTSNDRWYQPMPGCHLDYRLPFFLIPESAEPQVFESDTYAQLNRFRPYENGELLQMCMDGRAKNRGSLSPQMAAQLVACASNSLDITDDMAECLLRVHSALMAAQR